MGSQSTRDELDQINGQDRMMESHGVRDGLPGINGQDTMMGSHGAQDELDQVLDALLQAVPPEQRDTMRAHLQAAHVPGQDNHATDHRLAVTPDNDGHEAAGSPSSSIPALAPLPSITAAGSPPSSISDLSPVPSITPENIAQIDDDLVRTVLRLPAPVPPPSPSAEGLVPSERLPASVLPPSQAQRAWSPLTSSPPPLPFALRRGPGPL